MHWQSRLLTGFSALLMVAIAAADEVKLKNGLTLSGVILSENKVEIVLRFKNGNITLNRGEIASITRTAGADKPITGHLANWDRALSVVASRKWTAPIRQIPATVIDVGSMKNVPYVSHQSGDIEFNIYGDLNAPACIEIGVRGESLKSAASKKECVEVMLLLLGISADREALKTLKLTEDKKVVNGFTLEVTSETAPDSYGAWWVSAYDEKALDESRASDKDLAGITVSPGKASHEPGSSAGGGDGTADVRKNAGQSVAVAKRGTGSVYVNGYTRKDGTYVSGYTRGAPGSSMSSGKKK